MSAWTHETLCGTKYQETPARVCVSLPRHGAYVRRPRLAHTKDASELLVSTAASSLQICPKRMRARVRKTGLTNQAVSPGTGAYGCRVIMLSTVPRRRMRPAAFELLAAVREVGVTFWPRS